MLPHLELLAGDPGSKTNSAAWILSRRTRKLCAHLLKRNNRRAFDCVAKQFGAREIERLLSPMLIVSAQSRPAVRKGKRQTWLPR
jgi:hypothetical protein